MNIKYNAQQQADIDELKALISAGEHPAGRDNKADGRRVVDNWNKWSTGFWFVIGADFIWYVKDHGSDGVDWSVNNMCGSLGWRIPFDAEIAARLDALDAVK